MSIVKWMPKHNIYNIFDEVENMLDRSFVNYDNSSFSPIVNAIENEKEYQLMIDLPGIDKKEIDISFCDGFLTVSGERKCLDGERIISESNYGIFKRSFELSSNIRQIKIKASYKDGVLNIIIPKEKIHKPISSKIEIN